MGRVGPRGDAGSEAGRAAEPEGVVGVGEEAAGQAAGEREGGRNGGVRSLVMCNETIARAKAEILTEIVGTFRVLFPSRSNLIAFAWRLSPSPYGTPPAIVARQMHMRHEQSPA